MTGSSIQIFSPRECEIENAIFLSKKSIEGLDSVFLKWANEIGDKYKELTNEDKYKKELQISVKLELKSGIKLTGATAIDLFKRPEVEDSLMKSLTYDISTSYPSLVKLEIENSYSSRIRLSCSTMEGLNVSIDDCFYDFKDWIASVESSKVRKIFTSFSDIAGWMILQASFWGLMIPGLFSENVLKEEAKSLLEQGLTSEETPKAIEILLQDFAGEVTKTAPAWEKSFYIYYLVSVVLLLFITWLVKKFAIELGKDKFNYQLQQFIAKTIPVFLFLTVLVPYLVSKI